MIRNMKVLHVVTAFPRHEGDVITPWLVETIQRLRAKGIEVDVFAPSYRGDGCTSYQGIRVHRFRYFPRRWEDLTHDETVPDRLKKHWRYKVALVFYIACGSLEIMRLCRRERYDVIHVHWPFPHALFGFLGRVAGGGRLVSTFYGVELRWVKTKLHLLTPLLRWSIETPDAVIAISTHTAREINKLSSRKAEIVPYGVAVSAKKERKLISEQQQILFVGRLVERKGVDVLIRAFNEVAKSNDAELVIVGDGPERSHWEVLGRETGEGARISFRGRVPQEVLEDCYESADVFVLPAVTDAKGDTEGLGVVLLEAMSYGKPVVASRVGGIVDIVEDGVTGLLVPERDPEALSRALTKLLQDREYARSLGEKGLARVAETFDWDSIIEALLRIYCEANH